MPPTQTILTEANSTDSLNEPFLVNLDAETEEDRICLFNSMFSTLERYLNDLAQGADPKSIGTDWYFVQDGQLYKDISEDDDNPEIVLVPTSLTQTYEIISTIHRDLGHAGITGVHDKQWIGWPRTARTCTQNAV
jgi:hypothetical protein